MTLLELGKPIKIDSFPPKASNILDQNARFGQTARAISTERLSFFVMDHHNKNKKAALVNPGRGLAGDRPVSSLARPQVTQ